MLATHKGREMENDIVKEFGKVLTDEMSERDFFERINKVHGPSEYNDLVSDVVTLLINFVGPQHFVTGLALMEPCNVQGGNEIGEVKGDL